MVSLIATSVVGIQNHYKLGSTYLCAQHATLRSSSKEWLAQNQDNVSEWSDMSTRELLFL
jgi:hypothetical protein